MNARLFRVDLPGVKIHHCRLTLCFVDVPYAPSDKGVGEEPEISSAGNRDVDSRESYCGDRKLYQLTSRMPVEQMAKPSVIWDTIAVVANWENTRIIGKAFLLENIQSPEAFCRNRIARGTVPENGM